MLSNFWAHWMEKAAICPVRKVPLITDALAAVHRRAQEIVEKGRLSGGLVWRDIHAPGYWGCCWALLLCVLGTAAGYCHPQCTLVSHLLQTQWPAL